MNQLLCLMEDKDKIELLDILLDGVLIETDVLNGKTNGGIYMPDSVKDKAHIGTVLKVGPGKINEEMILKPGDRVMFNKWEGTDIFIDKRSLLHTRQSQIWATIENV